MNLLLNLHGSIFYIPTLYDWSIMAVLYVTYLLKIKHCIRLPNVEKIKGNGV